MFGIQPGDIVDVVGLVVIMGGLCVWLSKQWGAQHRPGIYRKAIRLADACKDELLIVWMRRGARMANMILKRLYGARSSSRRTPHRGYLNERAFIVSMNLASSYLTIGVIIASGIAVFVADKKGLQDRLLGLTLVLAAACSIYQIWRKRRSLIKINSDWFGALVSASLVCQAAIVLSSMTEKSQTVGGSSVDMSPIGVIFVFVLLISIWFILVTLNRAFGRYLPIGLLAFIPISGSVFIAVNDVSQDFLSSRSTNFWMIASLTLLMMRVTMYKLAASRVKKYTMNAVAFIGLAIPFFVYFSAFGEPFAQTWKILTDLDQRSGLSLIAYPFMAGTGIAMIGSLTYANAFCDWVSVGVTRRLLIALASARSSLDYARYASIDIMIAIVLVFGTYLLFTALTHIFLLIVPLPAEDFLRGLRSIVTESFLSTETEEIREFDTYAMGSGIAKFTGIFALTALIPTVFHLILLLFVLVGRLVLIAASIPAQAVLKTRGDVPQSDLSVPSDAAIDQVIRIGAYVSCAVFMAAYFISRML